MSKRRGTAVLDPQLVARPELVSQCVLHTLLLNLVIAKGSPLPQGTACCPPLAWCGMGWRCCFWHHTTRENRLRLALTGFPLLTDSMVFVDGAGFLYGYPVGLVKL